LIDLADQKIKTLKAKLKTNNEKQEHLDIDVGCFISSHCFFSASPRRLRKGSYSFVEGYGFS
jgi:hypothetical protein